MAKLEIPSIVVHSGSPSVPGVNMDRSPRQTPQLRKQKSSLDDGDSGTSGCIHHSKFESTGPPSNNTNNNNNTSSQNPSKPENLSGSGSNNKPGSPGGGSPKSDDMDRTPSGPQPQLSRSRSNAKMKMLTRSHAMREATSPPPDPAAVTSSGSSAVSTSTNAQASVSALSNGTGKSNGQASKALNNNGNGNNHHSSYNNSGNGNNNNNNNSKTKNGNHKNNKDQNNMSSNKSNHRQQNKNFIFISSPQEAWGGLLNRDPTNDSHYEGASKADLDGFIAQQMSTKNRQLLMRIEEELVGLLKEERMVYFRFPQMTSFHRMLVHRAASYFGMDHNLDSSGSCVVVSRNRNSRLPERNFLQIMRDVKGLHGRAYSSEEPRKSILKRDFASFEDNHLKSDEKQLSLESRRSKSFEEREEEYERARRRIFSRDDSADSCHRNSDSNQDSMEDVRWSECATWSGDEPEPPGRYLRPNDRNPRLLKTESYEGRDAFKGNSGRSAVSKSYSFGGYTGNGGNNGKVGSNHGQTFSNLQRGDSNASSISSGSRMLAKQDSGSSGSSRLSPSSSGYKSQSQQSDATLSATPSPTATPLSLLPMSSQGSQDTLSPEPPAISWPLPNNIPSGSVLINPATGQPICNSDGSVYRFDPENPLTLAVPHRPDRSDRPEQSESPAKATGSATNSEKENDKDTNKKELDQGRASQSASTAPQTSSKPSPDSSKAASSKSSAGGSGGSHSESKEERRPPGPAHTNDRKDSSKEVASSAPSSLALPAGPDRPDGSGRGMASAATSPMLVASPQRQPGGPGGLGGQPPTQAGQPIVLGGPGGAGYAMAPSPMVSMPVVPGQVQYPVPQFHNGTYTYSTGPAPGPDGQAYVNGYTTSVPYAVASYPVGVDPTTGAYVSPPQTGQALPTAPPPPGGPVPGPPPCCVPGYPCPYGAPGIAAAPHAPPHGGYDQRAVEAGAPGVAEMTTYMMGMSLAGPGAVDQRAGGDGSSVPGRADGQSPQQGPGAPPGPPQTPLMVAGTGSYYWGHQLSSHSQAYPSTVMYYYPPNNVQSPPSSSGVAATPVSGNANNSSYGNRGTSPSSSNNRESNSNKSNSNSSASTSSTGGNNRNSYNRNVAASYAKGAAIYQPPIYSMANLQMPPQAQDRSVINGYPNDCVPVGGPQQQVVYTVSSMHSSTVPTQSYQPAVYSNASAASSSNLTYYQGVQGAGDAASQAQGQQLVPVNPYAAPQGYMPAPGTPPLTPQGYPYVYGMYSQTANGPGGPASPATYSNIGPHQSPMIPRMMRPNLVVGGVQSSPPPRNLGPKGFPRGQSPSGRKDQSGSGDNVRFSQPYSVPMYSIASRYMSGDMRYMPGRLPFSIPPNTYRAIRPFQTSYYPRPHSQPSGEALGLNRPPRVRKPT